MTFSVSLSKKRTAAAAPPHHPAVPVLEQEPTEHAKIILYLFDK